MFWRTKLFSSRWNYEDSGVIQFLTLQNIRLISYYIALINNSLAINESRSKSGWNKLEKNNHELDHIEKNILVHPNIPAPPPLDIKW